MQRDKETGNVSWEKQSQKPKLTSRKGMKTRNWINNSAAKMHVINSVLVS